MRHKIALICLAMPALGLFLSDAWLGFRINRYSQLIAKHECGYSPQPRCKADFDGDGQFTEIKVQYRHDAPVELPPRFNGTEVVLNAFLMDSTFRTHIGISRESDQDRLIIYEGVKWPGKKGIIESVYKRGGYQLVETPPTEVDKEILAAMASRDDTGTFTRWIAYSVLTWPVRLICLVCAALLFRKHRRRHTEQCALNHLDALEFSA